MEGRVYAFNFLQSSLVVCITNYLILHLLNYLCVDIIIYKWYAYSLCYLFTEREKTHGFHIRNSISFHSRLHFFIGHLIMNSFTHYIHLFLSILVMGSIPATGRTGVRLATYPCEKEPATETTF